MLVKKVNILRIKLDGKVDFDKIGQQLIKFNFCASVLKFSNLCQVRVGRKFEFSDFCDQRSQLPLALSVL